MPQRETNEQMKMATFAAAKIAAETTLLPPFPLLPLDCAGGF